MFSQTGKIDPQKFVAYLKSKWGDRPCPMCGVFDWVVQDSVFEIKESYGGLTTRAPVIPVIPVVCKNCGNTVLVSAIVSGIVASEVKPLKGFQKLRDIFPSGG